MSDVISQGLVWDMDENILSAVIVVRLRFATMSSGAGTGRWLFGLFSIS